MVVFHLFALGRAPFADIGAKLAILSGEFAFSGHGADTQRADLHAFSAAGGTFAPFHLVHLHHLG